MLFSSHCLGLSHNLRETRLKSFLSGGAVNACCVHIVTLHLLLKFITLILSTIKLEIGRHFIGECKGKFVFPCFLVKSMIYRYQLSIVECL